ncbi:MAG TPA: serine hydrolase domain-containing protein [Candidatus Babeliales bacterium]|nr:serine hydrolase domain-containing protein [Candidatus Babeliales bacterium]
MEFAQRTSAAFEYARAHGLHALVVERNGERIAQEYGGGFDADAAHPIYSGTKSFWGSVAIVARDDGLLALDEPVADTIASWRDDPWKRRVTIEMLLSLTAGFGFGGLGASVPTYERALATPLRNEPGTRFTYGGVPLQVFGAILTRKLAPQQLTPHEYLYRRVLDPAGARVASWRTLQDGTCPLPTGASLRPGDWLAYGRLVLHERAKLGPCFLGTTVNLRYGLGWWLGARGAPSDLVYASGAAGQALYLVPSLDLAIVRFGKSSSYRHDAFLKRFFA